MLPCGGRVYVRASENCGDHLGVKITRESVTVGVKGQERHW